MLRRQLPQAQRGRSPGGSWSKVGMLSRREPANHRHAEGGRRWLRIMRPPLQLTMSLDPSRAKGPSQVRFLPSQRCAPWR
jgi:hypothetical protein